MKRLGFLTSTEDPELVADDQLVFPALKKIGFSVKPIIWDQLDETSFDDVDGLIFRSCWNYHKKHSAFIDFLKSLKAFKRPIFNSLEITEWNIDKKYLLELGKKVLIPRTKWIQTHDSITRENVKSIFQDWKVDQLVIKPAVSLNGHDTYLFDDHDLEEIEKIVSCLLRDRSILIQEFIPEITNEGEISLVYLNRKFSHAVRKTPAKSEFRVHAEYGGTREAFRPSTRTLAYAESVLERVKGDLLFSRVDLVESSRGPILIELEIADPMLYLGTQEVAVQNFANAIKQCFSELN